MRKNYIFLVTVFFLMCFFLTAGDETPEREVIKTSDGELEITFIGHASLMFEFNGMVIHVDPFSRLTDYSRLPDADLILITHDHGDHMDTTALKQIEKKNTQIILTKKCSETIPEGIVMANGDVKTVKLERDFKIEAVPAYNVLHKRPDGDPFHPKGVGNGYIITFGDKRVYIAGDTENIPEMNKLKDIDIAFLPANLPYTMTAEMVAKAAEAFKPRILYPYHFKFGQGQVQELQTLMKDNKSIELRIPSGK